MQTALYFWACGSWLCGCICAFLLNTGSPHTTVMYCINVLLGIKSGFSTGIWSGWVVCVCASRALTLNQCTRFIWKTKKLISGQLQKSTSGIACAKVMKNSHSISKFECFWATSEQVVKDGVSASGTPHFVNMKRQNVKLVTFPFTSHGFLPPYWPWTISESLFRNAESPRLVMVKPGGFPRGPVYPRKEKKNSEIVALQFASAPKAFWLGQRV